MSASAPQFTYGLDGSLGGWLVARLGWKEQTADFLECVRWSRPETIARLPPTALACVDIPIGLLERGRSGGRPCDMEARKRLGARSASVFSPPVRPALAGTDFPAALAIQRAQSQGLGISRQSFSLIGHIRAVDAWITPARQQFVREAHPELLFLHCSKGAQLPGKRTPEGRRARLELLANWLPGALLGQALGSLPGKFHVDAIDAIACAVSARRLARREGQCLGDGSRDSRGLLMQICF